MALANPELLGRGRLARLLESAGVGEIHIARPSQIEATLARVVQSGPDIVIAGGGDGTVSSAARFLSGTPMSLGILPIGTLNHFAREVGIPEFTDESVQSLTRSRVTEVDVGEVNGRVFINNSSIGIYPEAVLMRNELSARLGFSKYAAMAFALLKLFMHHRLVDVTIEAHEVRAPVATPFLFVGNNRYEPKVLAFSERPSLSQGILSIRYAHKATRLELLRIAIHALAAKEDSPGLETLRATELQVRSRRSSLLVALDGEVHRMRTPLCYRSLHRSLRVQVPAGR